jgi:hypothetical protein
MLTPKEALAKDGRIPVKNGRGRLSADAVKRIHELVAEGWQIKGYAVEKPSATPVPDAAPVVKRVAVANEKVVQDFTILYDERLYHALDAETKKPLGGKYGGMREVCGPCGVSLVQCHCGSPTILGDRKVVIVPRNTSS